MSDSNSQYRQWKDSQHYSLIFDQEQIVEQYQQRFQQQQSDMNIQNPLIEQESIDESIPSLIKLQQDLKIKKVILKEKKENIHQKNMNQFRAFFSDIFVDFIEVVEFKKQLIIYDFFNIVDKKIDKRNLVTDDMVLVIEDLDLIDNFKSFLQLDTSKKKFEKKNPGQFEYLKQLFDDTISIKNLSLQDRKKKNIQSRQQKENQRKSSQKNNQKSNLWKNLLDIMIKNQKNLLMDLENLQASAVDL